MLPDSPYGITSGLNPSSYPVTGRLSQQIVNWAAAMPNMGWFRFQIDAQWIWRTQADLPNSPQNLDWAPLDDAISKLQTAGFHIVFPLRGAPSWALLTPSQQATDEPFYLWDPTNLGYWGAAVAARYNGVFNVPGYGPLTIHSIEIGNEDFNIHHTSPSGGFHGIFSSQFTGLYNGVSGVTSANKVEPARDPHFFSACVAPVANAIRAVNTSVQIGMCSMWWVQPANPGGIPNTPISNYAAFLTQLYQDGVMSNLSYINVHYYSNATDPTIGNTSCITFAQAISDMVGVMSSSGDRTKQIWITEFGWQVTQVNTTSSTSIPSAGTYTVTPGSMLNIVNQTKLLVDTGAAQEVITATGVTSTTFQATFANAHAGTWAIVSNNTDCDAQTQANRYLAVMNTAKSNPRVGKMFFFTLDDKQTGYSLSSLIQYGYNQATRTSYVNMPAYGVLTGLMAANPQWPSEVEAATLVTRDGTAKLATRDGAVSLTTH